LSFNSNLSKKRIDITGMNHQESKDPTAKFKELGVKTIMLTGDNEKVAKWVSDELGLDEYVAEVLPHQKAEKAKEFQSRGYVVAMTGDGVNDAPALMLLLLHRQT
jgi:Cu2+-exporting ATPase